MSAVSAPLREWLPVVPSAALIDVLLSPRMCRPPQAAGWRRIAPATFSTWSLGHMPTMQALTVQPGHKDSARVRDVPEPPEADGPGAGGDARGWHLRHRPGDSQPVSTARRRPLTTISCSPTSRSAGLLRHQTTPGCRLTTWWSESCAALPRSLGVGRRRRAEPRPGLCRTNDVVFGSLTSSPP